MLGANLSQHLLFPLAHALSRARSSLILVFLSHGRLPRRRCTRLSCSGRHSSNTKSCTHTREMLLLPLVTLLLTHTQVQCIWPGPERLTIEIASTVRCGSFTICLCLGPLILAIVAIAVAICSRYSFLFSLLKVPEFDSHAPKDKTHMSDECTFSRRDSHYCCCQIVL